MSTTLFDILPNGYLYVILIAVLIAFHCFITGFRVAPYRKKYFNKEFFEKHFPELKGKLGSVADGYPDMGSGIFSQKLTLDQYLAFNNAQRAHHNYLEGLTMAVLLVLVSGLFYVRFTVIMGIAYIIGRELYTTGYHSEKGTSGRFVGVLVVDVALLSLLGASVYSTFTQAGGLSGLINLVTGKV